MPPINTDEIAAITGLALSWISMNIRTGSVFRSTPTRKTVVVTSSKEIRKVNNSAVMTPDRIIGKVTCQNTRTGEAPRFEAASSIETSIFAMLVAIGR